MTAPKRGVLTVVLGLLAVGLVLAGLSVEAVTRSHVARAQRALPGALARAAVTPGVATEASAALLHARKDARRGRYGDTARALEAILADEPTAAVHALAADAWLAADRGDEAARHDHLAARLEPGDAGYAAAAEGALDLTLAFRARGATRAGGLLGALLGVGLLGHAWRRRRERRRLERYLDDVHARLRLTVDGEDVTGAAALERDSESLVLDVFLSGRYGMACPKRPRRRPTLHVTFSHARASRTLRLRPVRHVSQSAIRIPVRAETLRHIRAEPGRWLVHVRLGPRALVTSPLDVREAPARRLRLARRA